MVSPYKETAVRVLKKIETEVVEGRYLDRKKKKDVLFEVFAERYYETHVQLENKNVRNQRNMLNGLIRHFKGKYLSRIDSFMIKDFMAKRIKVVKPASVNRDFTLLKSMFNRAIEWGMITGVNPTNSLKKLPENNERCRWLSEEEQETLLSCCSGLTRVIVLTALKTGMRWGEITKLKRKQSGNSNYVDFDNDVIFVHESLSKSNKSRYVPLSPSLKEELLKLPKQEGTDYIFWNPKTDHRVRSIRDAFDVALTKAGIEDFHFHDLRHTFASQLVRNNVDLYVVQKLLGHASPKMTQRYAHLCSDQLKDAIYAIERPVHQVNRIAQNDLQTSRVLYN
jgi:integrase